MGKIVAYGMFDIKNVRMIDIGSKKYLLSQWRTDGDLRLVQIVVV